MNVQRFTVYITQDHMDNGLVGASVSSPLAQALRAGGCMHPVIDDHEITFVTEDGREWVASLPAHVAAWQKTYSLWPDACKPVTVNFSAKELDSRQWKGMV